MWTTTENWEWNGSVNIEVGFLQQLYLFYVTHQVIPP